MLSEIEQGKRGRPSTAAVLVGGDIAILARELPGLHGGLSTPEGIGERPAAGHLEECWWIVSEGGAIPSM